MVVFLRERVRLVPLLSADGVMVEVVDMGGMSGLWFTGCLSSQ